MPQEITRTQIEKYTVYTGPTAESFSPIMAGITYPDPAYEILVYRRPLCVFEYVLSGRGHIERNGSILTVNAGDAYILTAGTYHHYYSDKVDPWTKIWFNVSGSLVQHLLSDYGLDGVTLIPRFHNETPLTRILDAFTADPVHSADKLAVLLHQYIQELADFLAGFARGIAHRGKCQLGDRTILDAVDAGARKAQEACAEGADMGAMLRRAAEGAKEGVKATEDMLPKYGKAAVFSAKAKGVPDQGAVAGQYFLEGLGRYFL